VCLDRDVSPMHSACWQPRPADPSDPGRVAALLAERASADLAELMVHLLIRNHPLCAAPHPVAASGSPLIISSPGQRALALASLDVEQVRRTIRRALAARSMMSCCRW
jgi:hypothetical protein